MVVSKILFVFTPKQWVEMSQFDVFIFKWVEKDQQDYF